MAVTRCLLLAGMAFAVVGSCFMLPLGGRHTTRTSLRARGGEEVDVKVGKTVQLTKEPPKQGVDLLGLVIGGVVGLVVAAGTALQGILKEAPKPWHPSQEPGNLQPVGFFDPLNFVKEDEKNFRKFRTAEIKHGRVAMMAAAGAVVQHYVRLPGLQDVPSGLAALQSTPGQIGAAVLFAACGVMELYVWKQDDKKEPGNFGDPAKWSQTGLGGGGNWVTVGYRFPPGPSLEALEAFWNAQRSNPWFQNHPILSDPDIDLSTVFPVLCHGDAIVELIKNDDVWQGDTQEERLRQAHVDFARECKRHRIRNRGVFPALKQLFWQSGSRE